MNRRLAGSLLGGGVASLLAFGGVKVGEKVHYDNQVKYFGGLRKELGQLLTQKQELTNWTIPKWQDVGIWKQHFYKEKDNQKIQFGKENVKLINSPEELRDECYKIISQKGQFYKECNGYGGWCTSCLFEKGWYQTDANTY